MNFQRFHLVGALLLLAAAFGSFAQETNELTRALAAWQDHLRGVTSVSSRFVQEKRMALFQEPLRLEGRMTADHTGRFAWEVTRPMRYKLLVNGDRITQWDEETDRVQVLSRGKNPVVGVVYEQMSAWLSGSIASLTNTYDARLLSEKPMAFEFAPKESSALGSFIQKIVLRLREDEQYLSRIELTDRSGDETIISFIDPQLNTDIPPEVWTSPQP